jgi:hypothetical protein
MGRETGQISLQLLQELDKRTTTNTGFMLLLGLGFIWTLGLLSFFYFITFYFQKFSVYLLWSVTKISNSHKAWERQAVKKPLFYFFFTIFDAINEF